MLGNGSQRLRCGALDVLGCELGACRAPDLYRIGKNPLANCLDSFIEVMRLAADNDLLVGKDNGHVAANIVGQFDCLA